MVQDNAAQLAALKPQLDTIRSTRRGFPIFGSSLRDHIASFGLDSGIAYPLQLCVTKLIELGRNPRKELSFKKLTIDVAFSPLFGSFNPIN